jgi:sigma-B regulation protein RsbU (phosphoserine phosphatase)
MTFPLKSTTEHFRPFLTRVTPLRGADGRVFRWLSVNTDIGEERAALELREQLMAVLGHDLRNPLHAITSGLALLQRIPLDERELHVVHMMQNSAGRIASLIDDVMDMARGRLGGGLALNRDSRKPLEPALQEVIAELKIGYPDKIVSTAFALSEPVRCDEGRIAQLFSNILGNALTYGASHEPVYVQVMSGAGVFVLSVANAGEPILEDDLKRLFQPFFRGAVRPNRQGLGLGLYIAHEIAVAHGGTLEVTSTHNETRFTFCMPT